MTTPAPPADQPTPNDGVSGEEMAERLFAQCLSCLEAAAVWLGSRLGWYDALRSRGPMTAAELAAATGSHPRYAAEWCEQQAVAGMLLRTGDAAGDRYLLPGGHAEALLDRNSTNWLEPLVRQVIGGVLQLPQLADAYAAGGGVSWRDFGIGMSDAQGDLNRPMLLQALPHRWVPAIPGLAETLAGPARVADVCCGQGWAAIGLATAFPTITVDGYDLDAHALLRAERNASEHGVADRVRFHHADVAGLPAAGYDLALVVEAVHDLAAPVPVLAAMRQAVVPGGTVLVIDEAAEKELTAPGDELQRALYGFSLLICLPDAMSHHPTAATGTVMRPGTLQRYATEAGFEAIEALDVPDTGFLRVYRLR